MPRIMKLLTGLLLTGTGFSHCLADSNTWQAEPQTTGSFANLVAYMLTDANKSVRIKNYQSSSTQPATFANYSAFVNWVPSNALEGDLSAYDTSVKQLLNAYQAQMAKEVATQVQTLKNKAANQELTQVQKALTATEKQLASTQSKLNLQILDKISKYYFNQFVVELKAKKNLADKIKWAKDCQTYFWNPFAAACKKLQVDFATLYYQANKLSKLPSIKNLVNANQIEMKKFLAANPKIAPLDPTKAAALINRYIVDINTIDIKHPKVALWINNCIVALRQAIRAKKPDQFSAPVSNVLSYYALLGLTEKSSNLTQSLLIDTLSKTTLAELWVYAHDVNWWKISASTPSILVNQADYKNRKPIPGLKEIILADKALLNRFAIWQADFKLFQTYQAALAASAASKNKVTNTLAKQLNVLGALGQVVEKYISKLKTLSLKEIQAKLPTLNKLLVFIDQMPNYDHSNQESINYGLKPTDPRVDKALEALLNAKNPVWNKITLNNGPRPSANDTLLSSLYLSLFDVLYNDLLFSQPLDDADDAITQEDALLKGNPPMWKLWVDYFLTSGNQVQSWSLLSSLKPNEVIPLKVDVSDEIKNIEELAERNAFLNQAEKQALHNFQTANQLTFIAVVDKLVDEFHQYLDPTLSFNEKQALFDQLISILGSLSQAESKNFMELLSSDGITVNVSLASTNKDWLSNLPELPSGVTLLTSNASDAQTDIWNTALQRFIYFWNRLVPDKLNARLANITTGSPQNTQATISAFQNIAITFINYCQQNLTASAWYVFWIGLANDDLNRQAAWDSLSIEDLMNQVPFKQNTMSAAPTINPSAENMPLLAPTPASSTSPTPISVDSANPAASTPSTTPSTIPPLTVPATITPPTSPASTNPTPVASTTAPLTTDSTATNSTNSAPTINPTPTNATSAIPAPIISTTLPITTPAEATPVSPIPVTDSVGLTTAVSATTASSSSTSTPVSVAATTNNVSITSGSNS